MSTRSIFHLILTLAMAGTVAAGTITVTSTADSGPGSLRQAISDAMAGDTIHFSLPANSTITLTSDELLIEKEITVEGPGANQLTVTRSASAPDFRILWCRDANVTISGLTISNGRSDGGGGIRNSRGTLVLTDSTISGNSAVFTGGGIFNDFDSTLRIVNSTIAGNSATDETGNAGGGIHNRESLFLTGSTISGNSAMAGGGIDSFKSAEITRSTISGNSATYSGGNDGGGGLRTAGPTIVTNTTITDNMAAGGVGGGIVIDGTFRARNTIIAGNPSAFGGDVRGDLISDGYNLVGNTSGANITGTTTGNQLNLAPKLGPLQDNGGPTRTHAPLSGSPAIEAGDSGGANVDQRGLVRPVDSPAIANVGDGADIGAYEVQPDQLPGCSDIDRVVRNNGDSGPGSLRAVIADVCAGTTITFAENVRGAIDLTSGQLAITKGLQIEGPGADQLSVQRSSAAGTPNFRIINVVGNIQLAISGLTIANGNVFSGNGGGIFNERGTLLLSRVAVAGNSSDQAGGGVANNGVATITHSTISGNVAPQGAGLVGGGLLNMSDSTISGNMALTGLGVGGGITAAAGTMVLNNITLAENAARDTGGGIFNGGFLSGAVRARNTIMALNTANSAPDFAGALTSDGFNLIGDRSGATISPAQSSDQIGGAAGSLVDPLLGPLQNNGGPTLTRALLTGSPAIDKGHASGSSTDQRGSLRPADQPGIAHAPSGDGADIGAFEIEPPPSPTPTPEPTPTPTATPTPTKLGNIATRLRVETGENVLIGGLIITGSQPKRLIVRAIGPSLPNVSGALANPQLEIYRGPELLAANDNWRDAPNQQEIIESTVAPTNDLESAVLITLPPGAYTAVVNGVNGETGVGSAEAYDLDLSADSTFANIATRGFVQTGADAMFGGLIITGSASQKVIVRAIGPSLGIATQLQDPVLELFNSEGDPIAFNDNWRDSQEADIQATTIPPSNDLESAIVATLPPTLYTAVVRGVNNTTGVALVEVYALQ